MLSRDGLGETGRQPPVPGQTQRRVDEDRWNGRSRPVVDFDSDDLRVECSGGARGGVDIDVTLASLTGKERAGDDDRSVSGKQRAAMASG